MSPEPMQAATDVLPAIKTLACGPVSLATLRRQNGSVAV
jgi:hypothetical protein